MGALCCIGPNELIAELTAECVFDDIRIGSWLEVLIQFVHQPGEEQSAVFLDRGIDRFAIPILKCLAETFCCSDFRTATACRVKESRNNILKLNNHTLLRITLREMSLA